MRNSVATLGAIESLLSIGGKHPWWAIGIFVLCLWVLHGLIVYSEDYARLTTVLSLDRTGSRRRGPHSDK